MKTPTDEQLNLAMCEWMGDADSEGLLIRYAGTPSESHTALPLPNYLSDDSPRRLLNEAEARLTAQQRITYWINVGEQVAKPTTESGKTFKTTSDADRMMANARQRVIAILQTVKPEMFL